MIVIGVSAKIQGTIRPASTINCLWLGNCLLNPCQQVRLTIATNSSPTTFCKLKWICSRKAMLTLRITIRTCWIVLLRTLSLSLYTTKPSHQSTTSYSTSLSSLISTISLSSRSQSFLPMQKKSLVSLIPSTTLSTTIPTLSLNSIRSLSRATCWVRCSVI